VSPNRTVSEDNKVDLEETFKDRTGAISGHVSRITVACKIDGGTIPPGGARHCEFDDPASHSCHGVGAECT